MIYEIFYIDANQTNYSLFYAKSCNITATDAKDAYSSMCKYIRCMYNEIACDIYNLFCFISLLWTTNKCEI